MAVKFDKFEEFAEDMDILQRLGDNPNADDGLSSNDLKAKFDEGGLKIKAYLLTMIGQMNRMVDDLNRQFEDTGDFLMGGTMQGSIDFNGHSLYGFSEPVGNTDAVRKIDLDEVREIADEAREIAESGTKKYEKTVTLSSSGWSGFQQTVDVDGVTSDSTVIVVSAPDSYMPYLENSIRCVAQAEGKLTFQCASTPAENVNVNILILE